MKTPLHNEVESRFGVLPNFFRLVPDQPEIMANLWGFARFAYLDNPLPSLFKERLFVYLSRFCEVRYCLARHLGFLIGLGRPAGDVLTTPQTIEAVMPLLRRLLPHDAELEPLLALCTMPMAELPGPDSPEEDAIFACAAHLFLQTADAPKAHQALERTLGTARFEYLKVFLTFVHAAHNWTKLHPELLFEDDINHLLATHEALAACVLNDPAAQADHLGQRVLEELVSLRQVKQEHENLVHDYETLSVDFEERKHVEEKLHESETKFVRVFHASPLIITISRLSDGRLIEVNETFVQVTGYSRKETLGRTPIELGIWVEPAQRDEGLGQLRAGQQIRNTEARFRMKDGHIRTYLIAGEIIELEGEKCVVTILNDISERKEAEEALRELNTVLEQRVEERTAELERSNRELDQFAYIAAHNLRSPLRGIEHLVNFVIEDASAVLPEVSKNHLATLRARVKRMHTLLTDLLAYARAGRHQHAIERINLPMMVAATVDLLAAPPGFTVSVIEPVPTLITERIPLESVLRNLLDNAIKHHHHPADGQVTIAVQVKDAVAEFTVTDNGPGIDPSLHQRIFQLFQTLKPRDQIEGSGIGLTMVRRLIESRGGQVWVESNPDQGTTFRFTWPQ